MISAISDFNINAFFISANIVNRAISANSAIHNISAISATLALMKNASMLPLIALIVLLALIALSALIILVCQRRTAQSIMAQACQRFLFLEKIAWHTCDMGHGPCVPKQFFLKIKIVGMLGPFYFALVRR